MSLETLGLTLEEINIKEQRNRQKVSEFLQQLNLSLDLDVDYNICLYKDEKIIATCSKAGYVLKCFGILKDYRGLGLTEILISKLMDKCFNEGFFQSFIFTTPNNAEIFQRVNFKLLCETNEAALLENGLYNIEDYLKETEKKYDLFEKEETAALIVNCNPMTLGHKYLIEQASKEHKKVLVFVVSADKSEFPFKYRYEIVKKVCEAFNNVTVIPGGNYIISEATFPSYFLKEKSQRHRIYTEIDAAVFSKYICKRFNITTRYIGEEPLSESTKIYNETLKSVLPMYGITVVELKRKCDKGEVISASRVRKLLSQGKIEEVKGLVPQETYDFLISKAGGEIIEKIT